MASTLSRIQQRLHELRDAYADLPTELYQTPMGRTRGTQFRQDGIVTWAMEVQSLLEMALPPQHVLLRRWEDLYDKRCSNAPWVMRDQQVAGAFFAILKSAIGLIDGGLLTSVEQGAKAETVAELLDVADDFLARDEKVAAAVLAGGALETHLRHLCDHYGVAWKGNGSIGAYNDAIAQERKAGNEIYSGNDVKQVTTWGGIRNDAAHDPTNFTVKEGRVQLMVDGIREFVGRTMPGK